MFLLASLVQNVWRSVCGVICGKGLSLWFGDYCVEAVRHLSKDEQEAVLRIIRPAYEKSDCERFLKEWAAAGIIEAAKDSFEVFPT